MTCIQAALKQLHSKNKKIIVIMMFGNIVGMPVNCNKLIKTLTTYIPSETTHLRVWVGAWRRAFPGTMPRLLPSMETVFIPVDTICGTGTT
jgi:hypothetical protein